MDQDKYQGERFNPIDNRLLLGLDVNSIFWQCFMPLKLMRVLFFMMLCIVMGGPQIQAQTSADGKLHVRDPARVSINLKSLWTSTQWANEEHTPGAVVDYTGEAIRFRVVKSSSGKSHMWLSPPLQQPVDILDDYPIFVMKYRATGYDVESKHQAVSVNDGMPPGARHHLRPMMCKQVISDGKIHEFRQDVRGIRKGRPAGPLVQIAVAVRCDDKGAAAFEVFEMGFERDPEGTLAGEIKTYEREQLLVLTVTDDQHRPLSGAKVSYNHMIDGFEASGLSTAQGRVSLTPWQTPGHDYALTIEQEGYVTRQVFPVKPGVPLTVKLEPATKISGQVLDGNDQPVAGAVVEFLTNLESFGSHLVPEVDERWPTPVLTDGYGRWSQNGFGKSWKRVDVAVWHPRFVRPYVRTAPGDERLATSQKLGDGPMEIHPRTGWIVTGKVEDDQGKPVADATVHLGLHYKRHVPYPSLMTDARGVYVAANLTDEKVLVTVVKKGHGPVQAMVASDGEGQVVVKNLKMSKPGTVRFLVVDREGIPQVGAFVNAGQWGDYLGKLWAGKTDNNGQTEWTDAPPDAIQYVLYHRKTDMDGGTYAPSDEQQVIVLRGPVTARGKVVDADTGFVIPSFEIRYATPPERMNIQTAGEVPEDRWRWHAKYEGSEGAYELTLKTPVARSFLRIAALGYEPVMSEVIGTEKSQVTIDVRLKPATGYNALVLTPQGEPANDAQVYGEQIIDPKEVGKLIEGNMHPPSHGFNTDTGRQGVFYLAEKAEAKNLAMIKVLHPSGYATLHGRQIDEMRTIQLLEWAKISGVIRVGDKPDRYGHVKVTLDSSSPMSWWEKTVRADEHGRYEVQVPAGRVTIARQVRAGALWWRPAVKREVVVSNGQELTGQDLGGEGRLVIGKLVWSIPQEHRPTWETYYVMVTKVASETSPLSKIRRVSHVHPNGVRHTWTYIPEGPVMTLDEHGNLRSPDMAAGVYDLNIVFLSKYEMTAGGPAVYVAQASKRFVVPPMPGGRSDETLVIGQVNAEPVDPSSPLGVEELNIELHEAVTGVTPPGH